MQKIFYFLSLFIVAGCGPSFLDEKPSSAMVVPGTLRDFQQLLDNEALFSVTSHLPDLMADDYYFEVDYWKNMTDPISRKTHIWDRDIFEGPEDSLDDWETPYSQVFNANIVLDGIAALTVKKSEEDLRDNLIGSALFFRAHAFYNLVQLFAIAYNASSASEDRGIPLPLTADINQQVRWASVQEVYDRMVEDLETAAGLLNNNVDILKPIRPSHPAVMGLLARIHLHKHHYEEARHYANLALEWHSDLLDFNEITAMPNSGNPEYLFYSKIAQSALIGRSRTNVQIDAALYESYGDDDLRKSLFYGLNSIQKPYKRAGFGRSVQFFSGLSTSEMLLVRAECAARMGDLEVAMLDLNTFRRNRYMRENFTPLHITEKARALEVILSERRKEFVFRGLRWGDIRRLNAEGAAIRLKRSLGDQEYVLAPGETQKAFPIPPNEIPLSTTLKK